MALLSEDEKYAIKKRRHFKSDKTGERHRPNNLEIHHKNRNPHDNRPENLRLLTPQEHEELHKGAKD
jgi:hypothetical protein